MNLFHTLTIITDSDYIKSIPAKAWDEHNHTFLVFAKQKPTSCIIKYILDTPQSKANVHIISFLHNQHKVTVDGSIIIWKSGVETSGHLLEEIIITGNQGYTYTKPVLDVANNAVSASHGARIHRLDNNQLFYLHSRGLSPDQAKKTILEGMIFNCFEWDPQIEIVSTGTVVNHPPKWEKLHLMKWVCDQMIWN